MSKKILLILFIGIFVLAACQPKTATPTAAPTAADTAESATEETVEAAVEETGEAADPTEVVPTEDMEPTAAPEVIVPVPGESMPCTTVFDYTLSAEAQEYQAAVDQLDPVTEDDWIYGNPDAPITIIEYADFQCPACPNFSMYAVTLVDAFPDSIRLVYRHLPLASIHDKAYITSMAAEAAGEQGKFWEMYEILYMTQSEWTFLDQDTFMDWLMAKAEELGLDLEAFTEDLNDETRLAEIEAETQARFDKGVLYTPFVVINDRIFRDNQPDIFALVGIYEYGGFEECPTWVIEPGKSYTAIIETTVGDIEIELYPEEAPLAVNSFVFLAQNDWYQDVYFHRVIEGFVAQAGDPSGYGVIGPGYTFANETNNDLSFDKAGVLGMANAGPDTNGSQFYLTLAPATNLDGSYTIFGQVVDASLSVLDDIARRDPQTAVDFEGATQIIDIRIIEE